MLKLSKKPIHKNIVISLSFSNFLKDKSGVPKVIMEHNNLFQENNISYISLFSIKKTYYDDYHFIFCKYGIIVDSKFIGIFQMNEIINYLIDLVDLKYRIYGLHIHHLLYNNLKLVENLLDTFYNINITFFIHDYYMACSNYNLLRNGETFCGGKGLNYQNCQDCKFYKASFKQSAKIKNLINKYVNRSTFVTPSEITKRLFLNFHPELESKILAVPHQMYIGQYIYNLNKINTRNIVNIAFLAMPNKHKGWEVYKHLAEKYSSGHYNFFILNSSNDEYSTMIKKTVSFSKDNPNAMVQTLRQNKIDIAFLWSLCAETYSYTYNEAFASNCFILTNPFSGNICDSVLKNKNGLVLNDEQELYRLFENFDKLIDHINFFREKKIEGPLELRQNCDILKFTRQSTYAKYKKIWKIKNVPLLFALNKIYKMEDENNV